MKKWIALLLALGMCLSLCACGGGDKDTKSQSSNQEEANDKDLIAVELINMRPKKNHEDIIELQFKVRNLSDEDQDRIDFDIQALDKNGDAIATLSVGVNDVDAGQAVVCDGWWQLQCSYDEIDCLKIKTYEFLISNGSGGYVDPTTYKLNEPITLVYSGEDTPDDQSATGYIYTWVPSD